jgi:predicted DNA-binding transcriptional regulator AlpA
MENTQPTRRKKYVRVDVLKIRYGNCSDRTIDRLVEQDLLPPPEYLGGRRLWDEALLDEYDARRPQESPPTPRASGARGRPRKADTIATAMDGEVS